MNGRIADSVPLAARGSLLVLVACLHVAGAAALSRLSELPRQSEAATILRASWIERPASPFSQPPSAEPPAEEPLPVVRPAPRPARTPERRQARPRVPAPSQPPAVQSAPATVDALPSAPAEPSASEDSSPHIDISAAVAVVVGGMADGERKAQGWGGGRDGDYVGPDFKANYLSNPEPEYPPRSRRLREQGLVKLRVHVTVEGRAGEVTLHTSSGFERLDRAALDAVKRWRFRPAQQAGMPVAGWVIVPVRFELHS